MKKSTPPLPPAPRPVWTERPAITAILLLAVGLAAWSNAWSAPFVFDDISSIVNNASIRRLGSFAWLSPPSALGETVGGRPVLNFSLALNHAVGGLDVRGYHGLNLFIHAAAGCLLWGILRRIPVIGGAGVALAIAAFWLVHPVQTASVTYVIQRAESLAGLFALLACYAFVRSVEPGARVGCWRVLAVVSGLLAFGTKESVAALPLVVFLYDRAFVSGSLRAAWRHHGRFHLMMAATWLMLLALVLMNHGRGGSAGFATPVGVAPYALTQAGAVLHYLRLAFWPAGLVFDHGLMLVGTWTEAALPLLGILLLLAVTGWALWRNLAAGFAGACFLLWLAPSSSVVPVATQTVAEHRFYLALAVPLTLVTVAVSRALRRRPGGDHVGPVLAVLAIAVLMTATWQRNQVYATPARLWADTVAKRPDNLRARYNLGLALMQSGHADAARIEFERTVALQPGHALAHGQLGNLAFAAGRTEEARDHFTQALAADPDYPEARLNLGRALGQLGDTAGAIEQYRLVLQGEPQAVDARVNLAALLVARGELTEGTALLREAVILAPELPDARYQLGLALAKGGREAEADEEFQLALRLQPAFAPAHVALGNSAARRGEAAVALASYAEALRLDARLAGAWFGQGSVLARQQRFAEAIVALTRALELEPAHVPARVNLANCQLVLGQFTAAIANYEAVLRVRPGDAGVMRNLEIAREARQSGR